MTTALAILQECRLAGVTLQVSGDRLKARGPVDRVEALLPIIKAQKAELLAELSAHPANHLDILAEEIAAEVAMPVSDVLGLLDADDRQAIVGGSDPGRGKAWRCAAMALAAPPAPIHVPTDTGFPRIVLVWTPSGRPVLAWAETAVEADKLTRWNPEPSVSCRNAGR